METIRLTTAQAIVKFLDNQYVSMEGGIGGPLAGVVQHLAQDHVGKGRVVVVEEGFDLPLHEKEIAVLLFAGTVTYQWAGKTVEAERPDCFHHEAYCLLAGVQHLAQDHVGKGRVVVVEEGLDLPLHAAQQLALAAGVLGLDGIGGVQDRLKGLQGGRFQWTPFA